MSTICYQESSWDLSKGKEEDMSKQDLINLLKQAIQHAKDLHKELDHIESLKESH